MITGFSGGMAGCAMIGQTIINVRAGNARTRLSTFSAGILLIILVVGLGGVVAVIPMAALVAVMVLVAVSTFDWRSVAPATLRRMPAGETVIMAVTVIATVATHNLAIGVGVGVLTAMVLFARRVAHLVDLDRCLDPDGSTCIYSGGDGAADAAPARATRACARPRRGKRHPRQRGARAGIHRDARVLAGADVLAVAASTTTPESACSRRPSRSTSTW